jgi:hypothetical protein
MNCPKCNGEMWDNRQKKTNPKAPDYKCKDVECDGLIWPPKKVEQKFSGRNDDQIIRQHSQEMALRYFEAKAKKDFTPEELIKLINFFEKDAKGAVKVKEPEPIPEPEPTPEPEEEIDINDLNF